MAKIINDFGRFGDPRERDVSDAELEPRGARRGKRGYKRSRSKARTRAASR